MELVDNMVEAKLFKSEMIKGKWTTASEQLVDFINFNLISDVIKIVEVEQLQYMKAEGSYTEVTKILLIYREGNE